MSQNDNFNQPRYKSIFLCISKVLLDVNIDTQSTYQMILRYTNPNPTPVDGRIVMHAPEEGGAGGEGEGSGDANGGATAETVEHDVRLKPTGGQV